MYPTEKTQGTATWPLFSPVFCGLQLGISVLDSGCILLRKERLHTRIFNGFIIISITITTDRFLKLKMNFSNLAYMKT